MAGDTANAGGFNGMNNSHSNPDFAASASPGGGPHGDGNNNNGRQLVRSLVIKAACLLGGAYVIKRLTKRTTRWDHSRIVAQSLSGEKVQISFFVRSPTTLEEDVCAEFCFFLVMNSLLLA
jgi:hypothetical protein